MAKEISDVLAEAEDQYIVEAPITVSTKSKTQTDDNGKPLKHEDTFTARLPKDLRSAVHVLGEKTVFGLFARALVVELQGEKRIALAPKAEGKERKRASYLDSLGL